MFRVAQYLTLRAMKTKNTLARLMLALTTWVKVTVLLFLTAASNVVRADDANQPNLRLLEFTSDFYMPPMGRGRVDGLMAREGSRYRIAIYWIEPAVFRDHTFFLGYSDFIFSEGHVNYWLYGMSEGRTFNLSESTDPLLPRDVLPESVARSALAIVSRVRSQGRDKNEELQVGKFFRQSSGLANYSYEVSSTQRSEEEASESPASDVEILNALPYGRKYSKQTQSDGTLVWRAQRVLDGPNVATVTVKPLSDTQADDANDVFDPNTLGRWAQIPGPYRAYWSFDQVYSKLKDDSDSIVRSRELHEEIETSLAKNEVPDRIDLAFNQLLFKTALLTGDTERVSRSAHAVVASIQRDGSINSYQGLLELARIDAQIRERYTQEADALICPLVAQFVRHAGPDAQRNVERFMPTIKNNKWFAFGKLLTEEISVQGLAGEDDMDLTLATIEASRLAVELPPYDPCQEKSVSVEQYLAQLDAEPPKGTLTLNDLHDILRKGLAKPFADANLELKTELIEDVIRSIRLIAGEGPFRGDQVRLIESINKFSGLYLVVNRFNEPIDTVLATFLALSLWDISTEEDHDALFSQIHKLGAELQSELNTMLNERGLHDLATPADVEEVFGLYERIFRRYIDDPLWPAFKFPLTENERTRLRNRLKPGFEKLDSIFDEIALKVQYGGVSPELKDKTAYEISRAIQQLLPQAAFLRNTPYPGVSCQYRGKYGFTAVIRGPLYIAGERPREKFKAMKYFHLGHRLEQVVMQERDLAKTQ